VELCEQLASKLDETDYKIHAEDTKIKYLKDIIRKSSHIITEILKVVFCYSSTIVLGCSELLNEIIDSAFLFMNNFHRFGVVKDRITNACVVYRCCFLLV
jgi:hypothetical protein